MARMRKKGAFIGSWLVDWWVYILFVLVILCFLLLFSMRHSAVKSAIESNNVRISYKMFFINYLRTPVEVDINLMEPDKPIILETVTMAELFSLAYGTTGGKAADYYKKRIREETANIFDRFKPCLKIKSNSYLIEPAIYLTGNIADKLSSSKSLEELFNELNSNSADRTSWGPSAGRLIGSSSFSLYTSYYSALLAFQPIIMPDSTLNYIGLYLNFEVGACK